MANDGDPPSSIEKMSALAQQECIWLFRTVLGVLMGYRDSVVREAIPLKSVRLINREGSTSYDEKRKK